MHETNPQRSPEPSEWESKLDNHLEQLEPRLIQLRRHLHSHPEPSGSEVQTSRYLHETLSEAGIESQIGRDGLGVFGDVTIGSPPADSPLIGIRADIDALKLPDEKNVEYASQHPGIAHACGHDAHSTIVAGTSIAGTILAASGDLPSGGLRLRLIFQPAEETSQGANWMVAQNVMDGVQYMLGLHVDPERPFGQVGIRYGTLTANCDELEITIDGRGGHSARPHHAHDPIAAAADLIQTCYARLPRSIDSRSAAVMTFGSIHGGNVANVIPSSVTISGTLRSTAQETRETLKEHFHTICTSIEQAHGVQISSRFFNELHSVDNHPYVTRKIENACRQILPDDQIKIIELPSLGGEDFSVYLKDAPGAMLRLGCAAPGSHTHMLHSPLFDIDERILTLGPRILFRTAWMLANPEME